MQRLERTNKTNNKLKSIDQIEDNLLLEKRENYIKTKCLLLNPHLLPSNFGIQFRKINKEKK